MKYLEITAKRDGFRRCGMRHPATPTRHRFDQFSEEELKRLKEEPRLVVVEVEEECNEGDGAASERGDTEAVAVKPEGEALTAAIVAVIPKLDMDTAFTQAGAPKVKAIEAALGYDVSSEDVAEAWAAYEAK